MPQVIRGSPVADLACIMHNPGSRNAADACGFSMVDTIMVVAIFATLAAIAVPSAKNMFDSQRLGVSIRTVERELQTARLNAVSAGQPIRVRFNCPAAGQLRRVELLGTVNTPAADDADSQATVRCSYATYPYPPADVNPLSRPNHDGPIQSIDPMVTFVATTTLEFRPDGSVWVPGQAGPTPGVTLTLKKGTATKSVTVNGLGKIQIQAP